MKKVKDLLFKDDGPEPDVQLAGADAFFRKHYLIVLFLFYFIFQSVIAPGIVYLTSDKRYECKNIWNKGENFDIRLYHSTSPSVNTKEATLLTSLEHIPYESSFVGDNILEYNYTLNISESIEKNRTIPYFIVRASPSRCQFRDVLYSSPPCFTLEQNIRIVRWAQLPPKKEHNLLTDKPVEEPIEIQPYVPYLFTNYSFDLVADRNTQNPQMLYQHNYKYFSFFHEKNLFAPPLSEDKFWQLSMHRYFLNSTNETSVTLNVKVMTRRFFIWNQKLEWDSQENDEHSYVKQQWEDMKRAMIDTAPLLLWTTIIVSFFHIVFNMMAFSEDISWWNSRKTMTGISIRSLVINIFSKAVVFLFLMDVDTSWIVRIMQLFGLFVELWKLFKILEPIMEFPYFQVKSSYKGSTQDADEEGFKYLGYALVPILLIYAIYQIIFKEFKSFYSYVINVAVGAVYAFGFLAMLPQIYINYRLKSVAGMSGSVLAYKFTSTFIDDLFAFVMTMPTMHRIACFRDDIVFFIWLYQRHIYPTDDTRTNEYGETIVEEKKKQDTDNDDESFSGVLASQTNSEIVRRRF